MKNFSFVIWMIGFPIGRSIEIYVNEFLLKNTYPKSVDVISDSIYLFIWVFIGCELWQKR